MKRVGQLKQLMMLAASMSLLGVATQAQAKEVAKKRDWRLHELKTGRGNIQCIASTNKKVGRTNYRLEINKLAGGEGPLEVFFIETGASQVSTAVRFEAGGKPAQFVKMDQNGDSGYFWLLPEEAPELMERLKTDDDRFKVLPIGSADIKRVQFSVRGAPEMIEEMEKRCNGGESLADTELAGLVDHADSVEDNVLELEGEDISRARGYYFQIHGQLDGVNGIKGELTKLASRYKKYIVERTSLNNRQDSLQDSIIPGILNRRAQARRDLASQEAGLVDTKNSIPPAKTAVNKAQVRFDKAEDAIAPHRPRHNSLVNVLESAERALSSLENELDNLDRTYDSNLREIDSLNDELDDIEDDMADLRRKLRPKKERLAELNQKINNFNKQRRIKNQLDKEPGFRNDEDRVKTLNQEIQAQDQVITRRQQKLSEARAELRACKKTDGGECSAEQAKVDKASEQVGKAKQKKQTLVAERNPLRTKVKNTRQRITNRVNTRYSNLVSERNTVERRVERLEDKQRENRRRKRTIVDRELPDLRDENSDLSFRRPSLVNEIVTAEGNVADADDELRAFDKRVGYAALSSEYNSSLSHLRKMQRNLSNLQSTKTRLERAIVSSNNLISQLNTDETTARNEFAANSTRIGELNGILADYDRERAPVEVRLADAEKDMNATSSGYKKTLE